MRIYTDGSCLGNPGPGGWAWAVDERHYESGYEPHTTNQRMELAAVLRALMGNDRRQITIVTDSAYIVNCFEEGWYMNWSNGYNKKRKAIVNWDLWWPVILDAESRRVVFEKVKGHSGDRMNNFVDYLARKAAKEG